MQDEAARPGPHQVQPALERRAQQQQGLPAAVPLEQERGPVSQRQAGSS
jgi:hypothetical protein